MRFLLFISTVFLVLSCTPESDQIEDIGFDLGDSLSIRGLYPLDDHRAWLAASKGVVTFVNAKENFIHQYKVSDEPAELRGIHAFDERVVLAMASGFPARIFKTEDGGQHWRIVYEQRDSAYFLDAIAFHGAIGYCLGDPVNGKFVLLKSIDSGNTWNPIISPEAIEGEACFAASNGNLGLIDGLKFISGGSISRFHTFDSIHQSWHSMVLDTNQGSGSGAFAFADGQPPLIVGGDYLQPNMSINNAWTISGGEALQMSGLLGYRSGIDRNGDFVIATGTNGTEYSLDNGQSWKVMFDEGFHSVRIFERAIWFSGNNGRVLRLSRSKGLNF